MILSPYMTTVVPHGLTRRMVPAFSGEAWRKSYAFSLRTGSPFKRSGSGVRSSRLEKALRFLASEREPVVLLFCYLFYSFHKEEKSKSKINQTKSKPYGKTWHLETGDSDAHHHPYRHRHELGCGELHVGGFHNKKNSAIQRRITLFFFSFWAVSLFPRYFMGFNRKVKS